MDERLNTGEIYGRDGISSRIMPTQDCDLVMGSCTTALYYSP